MRSETVPALRLAAAVLLLLLSSPWARAQDKAAIASFIERAVAEQRVPGAVVMVAQRGRIVFEMAAGYADLEKRREMRIDDIFMLASSSKPFAAATVLTLIDQGRLGLDDPVSKYLPQFKGASTVRQLLSHTSGIIGNQAPPEQLEPIRNFDRRLDEAVQLIIRQPLAYAPGQQFSYGGASYCVAGRIVETLTGLEFDAYLKKALLDPLSLRDTMYRSAADISARVPVIYTRSNGRFEPTKAIMELPDRRGPRPDGFILVPGGIYGTARDAVTFLQMLLNGGTHNGKRVLSQKAVLEMQKKQTGELKDDYGLGWWRSRVDASGKAMVLWHGGAYGTHIWIDLERELAGAVFTQMPLREARPFIQEVVKHIEQVAAW